MGWGGAHFGALPKAADFYLFVLFINSLFKGIPLSAILACFSCSPFPPLLLVLGSLLTLFQEFEGLITLRYQLIDRELNHLLAEFI